MERLCDADVLHKAATPLLPAAMESTLVVADVTQLLHYTAAMERPAVMRMSHQLHCRANSRNGTTPAVMRMCRWPAVNCCCHTAVMERLCGDADVTLPLHPLLQ
jgi:predicted metal-dependent hydrolase